MKRKITFVLLTAMTMCLFSCNSNDIGSQEKTYTVTWKNYDGSVLETDKGVKEGTTPHYDGAEPTKPEDSEYIYSFTGWTPELVEVTADQTYTATYSSTKKTVTYTITYVLDGGTNSASNPSSYVGGSSLTFADASKDGYAFAGWFDGSGKQVTGVDTTTTGNLTLIAHWTANKNSLSVTSEDESKGTVEITSGSGYSGESITVKASAKIYSAFEGWYNNSTKVSSTASYTFTMPTHDYSLVAKFNYDESKAYKYAAIPKLSSDGKTITYGLYPQTNVSNSTTLAALNSLTKAESNGWYFYDNEFYAKLKATPNSSNYKFDNGTTIVSGTNYWFKCEPITWKVLENNTKGYYLLSSVVLDSGCYYHSNDLRVINNSYVYPNDYEDSDIRAWLNNEFFNTAFNLDNDNIQETLVDNSAETTDRPSNPWCCNNTLDKVFLPSYQDYINTSYGFDSSSDASTTRQCKSTDWARAKGIYCYTKFYGYNGNYWTRSPDLFKDDYYTAWSVSTSGIIGCDSVDWAASGVRPSVYLKLS